MQMDIVNEDSETIVEHSSDASPKVNGEIAEDFEAILSNSQPDFLNHMPKVRKVGKLEAVGGLSDTGATVASSDYNSNMNDFSSDGYDPLKSKLMSKR
jgi:hypothetical protein